MTEHRASGRDPGAFAPLFRGRARTEAWVLSDQYALHAVMTRRGIVRAAARLHGDLWSPDLEKTQVIHPIGLLKAQL